MVTRLISVGDDFTLPASAKVSDSNLPARLGTAALSAAYVGKGALLVNVRDYGATGNGTTNDTAAVQAAINAVGTAGGGTVHFPNGIYNITNVSITQAYVTLSGKGTIYNGTINIGADGNGSPYPSLHTNIRGLKFDRSAASTTVNAITVARVYDVDVSGCDFRYYNACFYVRPQDFSTANGGTNQSHHTARIGLSDCRCENVQFFVKADTYSAGTGSYAAADITVLNCPKLFVQDTHIYADNLDGLVVTGCTMFMPSYNQNHPTKRYNVRVKYGTQINITGNNLFESGLDGILLDHCENFSITGNSIAFPGQRDYADGIRIIGGSLTGTEYGIGAVTGNQIMFPTRRGISIEDNCGHISVGANVIRSAGNLTRFYGSGTAPTPYLIRTEATTKSVILSGNTCTGTGTIKVLGVGTSAAGAMSETQSIMATQTPVASLDWSTLSQGPDYYFSCRKLSTGTQNAYVAYDMQLQPGTYTIDVFHHQDVNRAVYSVRLDSVEVGTVDGYAATPAAAAASIAGVVVGIGGRIRVAVVCSTKNASSAGYYGALSGIGFTRTGG